MARFTIGLGLALCAATVLCLLTVNTGRMATIFVPMIFGIPIFIAGVISLNPHRRRAWCRFAEVIAVIGAVCSVARIGVSGVRAAQDADVEELPLGVAVALAVALLAYAVIMHRMLRRPKKAGGVIQRGDSRSAA